MGLRDLCATAAVRSTPVKSSRSRHTGAALRATRCLRTVAADLLGRYQSRTRFCGAQLPGTATLIGEADEA